MYAHHHIDLNKKVKMEEAEAKTDLVISEAEVDEMVDNLVKEDTTEETWVEDGQALR